MSVLWLGIHHANWLTETDVPMMVSYRTLRRRKTLPRARGPVAEDSGGFTYLKNDGAFPVAARQYATDVRRHVVEIGNVAWAAVQDWMCEPFILAKTGLSVREHQSRTIDSYLDLREIAPDVPWLPIVQGWSIDDYVRHVDAYASRGVDLRAAPLVGVGSVCSRQQTMLAARIFGEHGAARSQAARLRPEDLRLCALARLADIRRQHGVEPGWPTHEGRALLADARPRQVLGLPAVRAAVARSADAAPAPTQIGGRVCLKTIPRPYGAAGRASRRCVARGRGASATTRRPSSARHPSDGPGAVHRGHATRVCLRLRPWPGDP